MRRRSDVWISAIRCLLCTVAIGAASPSDSYALRWSVAPVTNVGGFGATSPDINNGGEIVYGYTPSGFLPAQIFSTSQGQLTFPASWIDAFRPRINNLGEIIFVSSGPTENPLVNWGVCNLAGSCPALPPLEAVNNTDHNDLGEIIGVGLYDLTKAAMVSSTRGVLVEGISGGSVGINNSGVVVHHKTAGAIVPGLPASALHLDINEDGEIVFQDDAGTAIKFWDGATFHTVAVVSAGGNVGEPRLNDNREIVFEGRDAGGTYQIFLATPVACDDGLDNDNDGLTDFDPDPALSDPGCSDADDLSENDPSLPCDDGIDNDGDQMIDMADLGCGSPTWIREDPQCQDGQDNDSDGDMDFDGGVSIWGGQVGDPDADCSFFEDNLEGHGRGCGLGWELALILPGLRWRYRRRRRA